MASSSRLNEYWDPLFFTSKFKFSSHKQPTGKVWKKDYCKLCFDGITLIDSLLCRPQDEINDIEYVSKKDCGGPVTSLNMAAYFRIFHFSCN